MSSSSSFFSSHAHFPLFLTLISATILILLIYTKLYTGSVRIHVGTLTDFFLGLDKETVDYWLAKGRSHRMVCRVFPPRTPWSYIFENRKYNRRREKRLKKFLEIRTPFLFVTFCFKINLTLRSNFFCSYDLYSFPDFEAFCVRNEMSTTFERMLFRRLRCFVDSRLCIRVYFIRSDNGYILHMIFVQSRTLHPYIYFFFFFFCDYRFETLYRSELFYG